MGMTSEECLKANFVFELFLFYLRYPGDSFKVVGVQFKYKLSLESTIFDVLLCYNEIILYYDCFSHLFLHLVAFLGSHYSSPVYPLFL